MAVAHRNSISQNLEPCHNTAMRWINIGWVVLATVVNVHADGAPSTTQATAVTLSDVTGKWWIDPAANHCVVKDGEVAVYNESAQGAALHAEIGGMSWDNYRVEMEIMAETGTSPAKHGFPWNVQICPSNTNTFCQFFGDGSFNIGYVHDFARPGDWMHLADKHLERMKTKQWHKIELTARHGQVVLKLDGKMVNQAKVPTGTAGMVGLLVNFASDAKVHLRNMSVTLLEPTEQQLKELSRDAAANWEEYRAAREKSGDPVRPEEFPANKPGIVNIAGVK